MPASDTVLLFHANQQAVYEALAGALAKAGPGGRELFLTRLALMLANAVGDRENALAAIDACLIEGV